MRATLVVLALTVTTGACSAEGSSDQGDDVDAGSSLDAWSDVFGLGDSRDRDAADVGSPADGAGDGRSDVLAADVATEASADVFDAGPHVCPAKGAPTDCSPGTGTGTGAECQDAPSCYLSLVQKAVNGIVAAHPDWFDFTGPSGCPVIKDVNQFLDEVVAELAPQGYCVERDRNAPNEEITMKKDNAFTENFDLVSSAGCARSGAPIYTGYCAPAWW